MSSFSSQCGHVRRRLSRNQPLTGTLLQVALDAIGDGVRQTGDDLLDGISTKLRSGTPLDEYELHLMLDVFLLHARLAAASAA